MIRRYFLLLFRIYLLYITNVLVVSAVEPPESVLSAIEQLQKLHGQDVRDLSGAMMKSYIDDSVNPCNDFCKFACGNWKKYSKLYPGRARVSDIMKYNVDNELSRILANESYFFDDLRFATRRKAKDYYDSCMDIGKLRELGTKPLLDMINSLGGCPALNDKNWEDSSIDWIDLAAKLRTYNEDYIIGSYVKADYLNPKENIVIFTEPRLQLPNRHSYENFGEYSSIYRNIGTIYRSLNDGQIATMAETKETFIAFEKELAKISTNVNERKPSTETYERLSIDELTRRYGNINWQKYLSIVRGREVLLSEYVGIVSPNYYQQLNDLLPKFTTKVLINYLMTRFAIYAKQYIIHNEDQVNEETWKRNCIQKVSKHFDLVMANMFALFYLKYSRKPDAYRMFAELKHELKVIFQNSDVFDDQTRAAAIKKLDQIAIKTIGIPMEYLKPKIINERFDDVQIDPGKFFEGTFSLLKSHVRREQSSVGQESIYNVIIAPTAINSVLDITQNKLTVSAGSLIAPFYHLDFPHFHKYGVLGYFIAHEMSHAFDSIGRHFDYNCALANWWSPVSISKYEERTRCFVEQYNSFGVDGRYSLNENLADNVGLKIAYKAFKKMMRDYPQAIDGMEMVDGLNFTPGQLFFLAFVQSQCADDTDSINIGDPQDPHLSSKARVKGILSNSQEFANEFNCVRVSESRKCELW